jgi:hypothetical protein
MTDEARRAWTEARKNHPPKTSPLTALEGRLEFEVEQRASLVRSASDLAERVAVLETRLAAVEERLKWEAGGQGHGWPRGAEADSPPAAAGGDGSRTSPRERAELAGDGSRAELAGDEP